MERIERGSAAAGAAALRLIDTAQAVAPVLGADEACHVAWALKDQCYAAWSSEPPRAALAHAALRALAARLRAGHGDTPQADEADALAHWTGGIAHLTRGDMAGAIEGFDQAAALFVALGLAGPAAQTQVPKIVALSMLGRYADATDCADRARAEFVAAGDARAAGKVSLNLGALHVRRGNFAEAARYSREAAVLFARVGDHEHSVMADINMADALTSLGDFDEALLTYARARMRAGTHDFPVLQALVDESVALLQLARGRYDEALRGFENSRQSYEQMAMPQPLAIAEKQLADAYLELRMLPEALALYDRAAAHFEALNIPDDLAGTLAQSGRALALLGRHHDALHSFARAAALYAAQASDVGVAAVSLARAELELGTHQAASAAVQAQQAAAAFDTAGLLAARLRAQGVHALALLALGEVAAARSLFEATLDQARALQLLALQVRCLTGLGLSAQAQADDAGAQLAFETAVLLFEDQRQALPGDDLRRAFLTDHLRPYQELLRLALRAHEREPGPGCATQVLQRLDAYRARSLAERLASGPDQRADASTRAQRERLNWLYRQEQKLGDEGESTQHVTDEARRVELELLEQARRGRLTAPQAVRKASVGAPAGEAGLDAQALQALLEPGDALVEYGVLDQELFACVVTHDRVSVHRQLAAWDEVLEAVRSARFQLETLSQGLDHVRAHLDSLTRRTRQRMARLHTLVWAGLDQALAGCRRVIVVPHGQLGELPFAALHDGQASLAQRWEIACAPSARLALRHLGQAAQPPRTVLAIGDSLRLHHAAREAGFVAGLFPVGQVRVGDQASIETLRAECGSADIVHMACHARFRSDNPRFSALHLQDGALTAELVEGLPLRARLVVLSACETGVSDAGHGDEMVGLVRAFLVSGTQRVLASLWPIDDAVTADFMQCFYEALLGGDTVAGALRRAQIDLMRRHPHPFYWAGFTLHGGW
jgi:tetratricopeptide (TPR) repeat protein